MKYNTEFVWCIKGIVDRFRNEANGNDFIHDKLKTKTKTINIKSSMRDPFQKPVTKR